MRRDKPGGAFVEQLREAVQRSDLSLNELSQKAGIGGGTLSRFREKKRDLSLKNTAALVHALGLRLVDPSMHAKFGPSTPDGTIKYFPNRVAAHLGDKLGQAKETIQILTTRMTNDRSLIYINSINSALKAAKKPLKEVTILASHPENEFLGARARQLNETENEYRAPIRNALNAIYYMFMDVPKFQLRTYRDFPIQLWYRVDWDLYVSIPSIGRHTESNCVVTLDIELPGVKHTFLDHFDKLYKASEKWIP